MCNISSVVLVCRLDLCFDVLLLAILGQGEGGMTNHEVFEETNFVLQKGAMLPMARLAYKTVGALNAARDNAVLVPSWYTGTHTDTETYMLERRGLSIRGDISSS